jgi:hypothetical protein
MADEIRGMADKLKGIEDKDELNMEDYDNTPNDATSTLNNSYAYQPNNTQVGNRMDGNMPKGNVTFEDQLMADYKNFVNEAEEKTMSKAAKGMMKYGKEGLAEGEGDEAYVACIVQHNRSGQAMVQRTKPISRDRAEEVIRHALSKNTFVHPPFMTIYPASAGKLDGSTIMAQFPDMSKEGMKALAKAGKDGKDLDKVRDKYNKYDEASHQANVTMKHVNASDASPKVKAAIGKASKDIKPGVKGYADRAAALNAAGVKR